MQEIGNSEEIKTILKQAKKLAQRYRALTGKPLGVPGEVAEYEAAQHLKLEVVPARQAGYDGKAIGECVWTRGEAIASGRPR